MDNYFNEADISQFSDVYDNSSNIFFSASDLFGSVSPDQIAIPYYDIEPVWRGVSLMSSEPAVLRSMSSTVDILERPILQRPTFGRDSTRATKNQESFSLTVTESKETNFQSFSHVPEVPFLLIQTHFDVQLPISVICSTVEKTLTESSGLAFEFNEAKYEWNATHLSGSSHCKFEIHIYSKEKSFVLECNRLFGDSKLFRSTFNQLQSVLASPELAQMSEPVDMFVNPVGSFQFEEESTLTVALLDPVLRMAAECTEEAQVEAARLLCDLSLDENNAQVLCEAGCVLILRNLLCNAASEWAKQHAVSALANLSTSVICQEPIIHCGVLPVLLQLATDGPYQSSELRRLAVFILANLTKRLAPLVLTTLGQNQVSGWMNTVDGLQDQSLKLHALRAKDFLSCAIAV